MNSINKISLTYLFISLCLLKSNVAFSDPNDDLFNELKSFYGTWMREAHQGFPMTWPVYSPVKKWAGFEVPQAEDFESFVTAATATPHFSIPLVTQDLPKSVDPAVQKFLFDYFYRSLDYQLSEPKGNFLARWLQNIDEPTRKLAARRLFGVSPYAWMNKWYKIQLNTGFAFMAFAFLVDPVKNITGSDILGKSLESAFGTVPESLQPTVAHFILISSLTAIFISAKTAFTWIGLAAFPPPGHKLKFFRRAISIKDPVDRTTYLDTGKFPASLFGRGCKAILSRLPERRRNQ